ncbi:MAG: hypothetical protein KDB21_17605, partial [Acidimicrobiales bacterium]|nr:hypothetical protein [Acidimicrobiales bacterium]
IGNGFSCAVRQTGNVVCWGMMDYGVLGDGTNLSIGYRPTPGPVSDITTAVYVTSGWYSSCAQLANGTAQCWGPDTPGITCKKGDGTIEGRRRPVDIVSER